MRNPKIHNIAWNAMLIVLVIGAALSAVYIKDYTGYAANEIQATAGSITEVVLEQRLNTVTWTGFFGVGLALDGFNVLQFEDAEPGELSSENFIFNCLEPNIDHEIYASTIRPEFLDMTTARAGTPEMVEDEFNLSGFDADSPSNTFTLNGSVEFGSTNITNVPFTYTRKYPNASLQVFGLGILNISNHVVFFTHIEGIQEGFNNQLLNYQLLVTAPNETRYYFWADPFDDCPEGLGIGLFGTGHVSGYVYDNITLSPLNGVEILIGEAQNFTNASGFYNASPLAGFQYLVARLDGYDLFAGAVNVTVATETFYNFSMIRVDSSPFNGTIQGTIVDNTTNETIEDVSVYVGGTTLLSNGSGFYNGSIPEGSFTLLALKNGYEFFLGNVSVTRNLETIFNFTMQPNTGKVVGFVFDALTGDPVTTATITIGDASNTTNASGWYNVSGPIGDQYLIATAPGYDSYVANITVISGQTIYLNITLETSAPEGASALVNGTIQGYVVDNGTRAALANVTVSIGGGTYLTDENGFYNISAYAGEHTLAGVKDLYRSHVFTLDVQNNVTLEYNFSLIENTGDGIGLNGSLTGTVTNTGGAILDGVLVSIAGKSAITNITGEYFITVVDGTHNLVAIKDAYETYFDEVNVSPATITEYDFVMEFALDVGAGPGAGSGGGAGEGAGAGSGSGTGTGIGPGDYTEKPAPIKEGTVDQLVSISSIVKKLRKGSFLNVPITITNYDTRPINVDFQIEGEVAPIVQLDRSSLSIGGNSNEEFIVTLLGKFEPGVYEGNLVISGDITESIPIIVLLYEPDKLPIEALLMEVDILDEAIVTGDILRYRVDLQNVFREEEYQIELFYTVTNQENGEEFEIGSDNVTVQTSFSLLKNYQIPDDFDISQYMLTVEARYLDLSSEQTALFRVVEPLYRYSVFGVVRLWVLVLIASVLATAILGYIIYKKRKAAKQRYKMDVDFNSLPQPGPRSAYVGLIAETNKKAYIDLDKLQIHSLIAGSSGGGKSVAAQVIVEEALMHDVGVIVFDPTAQWSGFLRKCTSEKFLPLYARFGMKPEDARAFNGNVHQLLDAREIIDIKKFMVPGEIHVFTINKLDFKDSDIVVANTIKQVFRANLPETPLLKLLIIFDEVHRLLPKFGGSGYGFTQIERGAREFRKWGVGLFLISQVLSDFMGQTKANINTEIQMRTRHEGDLKRIQDEYGENTLRSLVKSSIGTGMINNAAYNQGKPYFISFRALLHDPHRLKDDELDNYNKYNDKIDELDYQLQQLKEEGLDVIDLELELKLSKDKIKSGQFNMVDIYLEGLVPRIEEQFKKLGKTPKKLEKELVDLKEIEEELSGKKKEKEKEEKAAIDEKGIKEETKEDAKIDDSEIAKEKEQEAKEEKEKLEKEEPKVEEKKETKEKAQEEAEESEKDESEESESKEEDEKESKEEKKEDSDEEEKKDSEQDKEDDSEENANENNENVRIVYRDIEESEDLKETESHIEHAYTDIMKKHEEEAKAEYQQVRASYKKLSRLEKLKVLQQSLGLWEHFTKKAPQQAFKPMQKQTDIQKTQQLIGKAKEFLQEGKKDDARAEYVEIMTQYKHLSEEDKKQILDDCLQIREQLRDGANN